MKEELYFEVDDLIEHFNFLCDFGYELIDFLGTNMYASVEYSDEKNRVNLLFDYKDFAFYFYLIRGSNTIFPDERPNDNIISFWDLAIENNPDFDLELLIPNKKKGSIIALKENAKFLKSYGNDF